MLGQIFNTTLTSGDLWFLCIGAARTLLLTVLAVLFGSLIGLLFGVLRAERGWIASGLIGIWTDAGRSVPLLIQLIVFNSFMAIIGFPMSAFASGLVVLSLYMAANVTEVVRAGVQSVRPTIRRASRSLGMTYGQSMYHIVLPIGFRTVFAAWIGIVLSIMKDSSLVSVLGYFELLRSSQTLISRTQEPLLILIIVGAFYFVMSYPIARFAARLEHRMQG
jgi:hydroxyproline transport system permease protein